MEEIIKIENLVFEYRKEDSLSGDVAVDDVSLSIERGSFTAIIGRNGSGKCGGIILSPSWIRPVCVIHPITSKGLPGRCKITVPYNKIENVIAALQEFKAKLDEK